MKYRTVIELTCEAPDKDEACDMAGAYLKGDIDFGVDMICTTSSLPTHRLTKCAVVISVFLVLSLITILRFSPIGCAEKVTGSRNEGFCSAYALMPALKTKHRGGFKGAWEKKHQRAKNRL
ncbi:MAG: hypothetical protein GF409_07975 [Candidatus Omnitrophica bacterium]|nr:hypothetical protein [Candidatus Omnitrophota bacterium]